MNFDTIWNVPQPNSYYQARFILTGEIQNKLVSTQTTGLSGAGGIGKTQLAIAIACLAKTSGDYAGIRWINAETQADTSINNVTNPSHILDTAFRDFAQSLGESDFSSMPNIKLAVENRLNTYLAAHTSKKVLVIFDNADNYEQLKPYMDSLSKFPQVELLITTRDATWPDAISVDVYQDFEAIAYVCRALLLANQRKLANHEKLIPLEFLLGEELKKHCLDNNTSMQENSYNWQQTIQDSQFACIKAFVEKLECYPLAMTQALAYCVKQKLSLVDFLKQFDQVMDNVMLGQIDLGSNSLSELNYFDESLLGERENRYDKTIYLTVLFSINALKAKAADTEVALVALKILGVLGYLAPDKIPQRLLYSLLNQFKPDLTEAQRKAYFTGVSNHLKGYSFLHSENSGATPDTYHAYRLVQRGLRYHWMQASANPDSNSFFMPLPSILTTSFTAIRQLFPDYQLVDENVMRDYNQNDLRAHIEELLVYSKAHLFAQTISQDQILAQSALGLICLLNGDERVALSHQQQALEASLNNQTLVDKLTTRVSVASRNELENSLSDKEMEVNNDKPRINSPK